MFNPPSLVPRCSFSKILDKFEKKKSPQSLSSDFTKEPLLHEVILVVLAALFCLCICCCCCCRYWRRGSGRPTPSGVSRARSGEWRVIGAGAEDESKESSEGGT